jgi:hypothetical protein
MASVTASIPACTFQQPCKQDQYVIMMIGDSMYSKLAIFPTLAQLLDGTLLMIAELCKV